MTKTTVTPAMLVFYMPLAALPYRPAQMVWLIVQWLMLLGSGWLWCRRSGTPLSAWMMALFFVGFTYTPAWRWEAERGQIYELLSFLFACWLFAMRSPQRGGDFYMGCLAGILIALRPPFFLLFLFLALHRRSQLMGAIFGSLLGLAIPMLILPSCWTDYLAAMQTNSEYYRNGLNPARGSVTFPPIIEGTPSSLLGQMMGFPFYDITLYAVFRRVGLSPIPVFPVLATVGALYLLWLYTWRARPALDLLPGLAGWLFLVDLFLPITRYGYDDLAIINVALCSMATAKNVPLTAWICLLTLPLAWALYFVKTPLFLASPASLFSIGAVVSLFDLPPRKSPVMVN
jgi:hypothetical protein